MLRKIVLKCRSKEGPGVARPRARKDGKMITATVEKVAYTHPSRQAKRPRRSLGPVLISEIIPFALMELQSKVKGKARSKVKEVLV